MEHLKTFKYFLVLFIGAVFSLSAASAQEQWPNPSTYVPKKEDRGKQDLDDPTDLTVTRPYKDILPPEIWNEIAADPEKMKKETAELLGFTAPELVGKIAPEIKPGKYTYKDLEKYPGLKELFPPLVVEHVIKPGGPPFVGNVPEFEIIPTRQFHRNIKLLEATKRYLGKAALDKDGYIVAGSWQGGIPFPRPSGKFKAQQVFYNFEKRAGSWDECWTIPGEARGLNKDLIIDYLGSMDVAKMRWKARSLFPPYGWFDKRAEENNEMVSYSYTIYDPRVQRGTVLLRYLYDDPGKPDTSMVYVPSLRRIRKLSSTDTQDPTADMTYDDQNMLLQKITPNKYPYKYDIIEEREYLMFFDYATSTHWYDSKNGYAIRDVKVMRRPCYVLQMTQLDPNYVYSKRIFIIDKELFDAVYCENYDQRGRLYRTQYYVSYVFSPEGGIASNYGSYAVQRDYIDLHCTTSMICVYPVPWSRSRFSMEGIMKKAK